VSIASSTSSQSKRRYNLRRRDIYTTCTDASGAPRDRTSHSHFRSVPDAQALMRASDNKPFYWSRRLLTDNATFQYFLPMTCYYGIPTTALLDPNRYCVSDTFAKALFLARVIPFAETISTGCLHLSHRSCICRTCRINSHLKYELNLLPIKVPALRFGKSGRGELWSI